ncbi:MAG: HypC/HybG/HupF family hydrogenase formation chaperone [Pirellula staleyi]
MCLGVPGRVSAWLDRDPLFARANIEFDGIQRECHMACVPEAEIGDYVIIHAGVAVCLVNQAEARRVFDELNRMNLLAELEMDESTGAAPIESKRDKP